MAAQKGRDVIIAIGDGADPENFDIVAGLRAKTFSFAATEVDATDAGSPAAWRELLVGAGTRSCSVTGSGIFKSGTAAARMRQVFFDHEAVTARLTMPGLGEMTGPFQITNLGYAGEYDGEATYTMTLASAGQLSFVSL
jgi:TP901-1 family phage major tail protein